MTVLVLHDGMSLLRARLERDLAKFSLRQFLREVDEDPNLTVFVFDGKGNKAKRRELYPEYKATRKPALPQIYEGIMLIKEALQHTKAWVSTSPEGYEADDVIYTLAKMHGSFGKPVAVATRDYDLRACVKLGPAITCLVEAKEGVSDWDIHLYKTWVGDPSDNIPGVKGFGQKTWEGSNKDDLLEWTLHLTQDTPRPGPRNKLDPKFVRWLDDNADLFRAFWKITDLWEVPEDLVIANTTVGVRDPKKIDELLGRYFL